MRKSIAVGLTVALLVIVLFASFFSYPTKNLVKSENGKQIAVIYIEGPIMGGRSGSDFLGGITSGAMTVMDHLRKAAEDPSVEAVMLRLNTPGGSVPASQEIAQEIIKLKETGKPVVASMGDVCASAGYHLAALADVIVANPATITGSIGVYMQVTNLEELYDKLGIEYQYIKSGEFKDMGATNRSLQPEERELLQTMVDEIYEQFVEEVAQGRNLPLEKVLEIADGRIMTGSQGLELGLVDYLGNFYDALEITAEKAGIEGKPSIKTYHRPSPLDMLFSSQTAANVWRVLNIEPGNPVNLHPGLIN